MVLALHRNKAGDLMKRAPAFKPSFDVVIESRRLWRKLQFKWVRSDEVVYFLARKHPIMLWNVLYLPIFFLILLGFILVWGLLANTIWTMLFAGAGMLGIGGWIVWLVIDWGNDYYMVTNQRVVWLEKVVGIFESRTEAPLGTVLSIGVESDQMGRILGYGNVIIRTFVGQIVFQHVGHPQYAAGMIEEYWGRVKAVSSAVEKDAFKNAIRKQLGLPIPPQPTPPPVSTETKMPPAQRPSALRLAISNMFQLRIEQGDTVTYRKHVFVLWQDVWQPTLIILVLVAVWIWRFVYLAAHPDLVVFGWMENKLKIDSAILTLPLLLVPTGLWWAYRYLDWANDIFKVTQDQVLDIDKKPFGKEERRVAPIDGILSTSSKRIGIWGNLFNFGTVYIAVGGMTLEFQDVFDPANVQSDIDRRRMARQAAKSAAAIASEREKMAEWVAAYHRSVNEFRQQEEDLKKPKPQ
jgi:hypothetical protein